VLAVASISIIMPGHASAVIATNVPAGWVTPPNASVLHLPAGKKYAATVYRDRDPSDSGSKAVRVEKMEVENTSVIVAPALMNGGLAARIVPAS